LGAARCALTKKVSDVLNLQRKFTGEEVTDLPRLNASYTSNRARGSRTVMRVARHLVLSANIYASTKVLPAFTNIYIYES